MSDHKHDRDKEFIAEKVKECSEKLRRAQTEIATEVWGQDDVIELTLACMVAGGHLLSVGVPGLAKTRLVSRVATVMGLDHKRIQFTPDLMPSDIIGSEVLQEDENGRSVFRFDKGPIFTQFLMADEINRAGPRTQSALLEAMQEKKVTAAGHTYNLRQPFTVMATQNPLEQEGTYPLPEAQLDRFLMRLDVDYPDEDSEKRVMIETTGTSENIRELFERSARGEDLTAEPNKDDVPRVKAVLEQNDLILMQKLARKLELSDEVINTTARLVRNARPESDNAPDIVREYVDWGPGPRAVQAFAQVAKARALMEGRMGPNINDVFDVIKPVLEHRMALNYKTQKDNVSFSDIFDELKSTVNKPFLPGR